jgi:hypothetical protein
MSGYDVRFVTTAQMRALDTQDPYSDDFYFHNFIRKQEERKRREAAGGKIPQHVTRRKS